MHTSNPSMKLVKSRGSGVVETMSQEEEIEKRKGERKQERKKEGRKGEERNGDKGCSMVCLCTPLLFYLV